MIKNNMKEIDFWNKYGTELVGDARKIIQRRINFLKSKQLKDLKLK